MKRMFIFGIGLLLVVGIGDVRSRLFFASAGNRPYGPKQETKEDLVSIVLDPKAPTQDRIRALETLRKATGQDETLSVASLIQPHVALDLRVAAVEALEDMTCVAPCVRVVLHYAERVWRGERKLEDRFKGDGNSEIEEKQSQLDAKILVLLARRKTVTGKVLEDVYGLGTASPSLFALHIVDSILLKEACDDLVHPFASMPPDPIIKGELTKVLGHVCSGRPRGPHT